MIEETFNIKRSTAYRAQKRHLARVEREASPIGASEE